MTIAVALAPELRTSGRRLAGHRQEALAQARQRLAVVVLVLVGLVGVLALRLLALALLEPAASRRVSASPPGRAEIVDRNGLVLATTYQAYALAVRPGDLVGDREELARRIHAILPHRSLPAIRAALHHQGPFRFVARRILPEEAEALRRLGEPGLVIEREPERLYTHGALAAHVLGFTDIDGHGAAGIERAFDARLRDPARRHEPLVLALDARVQQVLEAELEHQRQRQRALAAAGVVLDARTSEVLALASLPAFNPNAPGPAATQPDRMNRITLGVHELGSILKPLTVAMALEAGTLTSLSQTFPTTPIHLGRHRIRDLKPRARPLTVPEVLILSSNVGSARMAEGLGASRQRAFLSRLGLLAPVPVELPERGRPLFPREADWGLPAVMTIGFGHGLAVTPLHAAAAYAALVNGGLYRPPTLLKRDSPAPAQRVFSAETSRIVRAMLRVAVTEGTGRRADAPGYRVGGKTGTAEKPKPGGGYDHRRNVTSFAGAFPMDDPRYVVVVTLDEPQGDPATGGGRTAGVTVAPAFRNVVLRVAPVLGIPPDLGREADLAPIAGLYEPRAP
ncbi:MAG: penicillin-binding protein 2 [Sphingomonadaceae bacterium]|uniref:peptidoglycan D,D-transpeptidase FtsI family protein n=1 Tax=Thermaurantiacus sp. TaxID=2820283 RepID=UPI00298ED8EE|nr:penicillin-binding protein 2 [Thermaurantiacus sp.]MCS6986912.1 penicillin-binding protein 2 [Sphingomonadaceae bacterium]MDW8415488.1 penicillin-binding protein 2 [Thermaurantiacus sp.]